MKIIYSYEEMQHMFMHSSAYQSIKYILKQGRHLKREDFPSTIRANYHHLAANLVIKLMEFENSTRINFWEFDADEATIIEIFHTDANS